jgi:hypothetical protein
MDSNKGLLRYKKPNIVGPGIWYSIHVLVENACTTRDPNDFNLAYKYIITIKDNFPCLKCKKHFEDYFKEHSPEGFKALYSDGKMIENPKYEFLSKWAYNLHNNVNAITESKNSVSYEEVIEFFRDIEACTESDCNEGDSHSEEEYQDNYEILPPLTTLTVGKGAIREENIAYQNVPISLPEPSQ